MKLSVSIVEEDVEFLDAYTKTHGIASRSAAVQQAIRLLRASELSESYAAAFTEWADGEDEAVWDVTTADS
jgi:Arc/MetJ-type ribon-helix-helix transcriptional regulator